MTRHVIRANLRLLRSEEGGRSSPLTSGYRSLARFEGADTDFGFELELENECLAPGETGIGRLSFWGVGELPDLTVGQPFQLREGTRIVGHGTIINPRI
jgi:translation elongation factor EF-Tu-like GTPase